MAVSTPAEVVFLQDMLQHHEDALVMVRTYLRATTPATRLAVVDELAQGIVATQTAEMAVMRKFLDRAGAKAKPASSKPSH